MQKNRRLTFRFETNLLERLDRLGEYLGLNRSEVVRLLLEEGLDRREGKS